ncbi:hypothetical protein JCM5350_005002 [Sporobolomyces pararoseus]
MLDHQAAAARTDLDPKPSSLRPIDPTCLLKDEALQGIPTQFVKDVLRDLAPRILAGINCTSLDPSSTPDPAEQLPSHARCTFDPSLAPGASPLPPNFLLALTFPPRDTNLLSPPTRILVPCHSLVYTLSSPIFPIIPSAPTHDSDISTTNSSSNPPLPLSSFVLPVMGPVALPSLTAFSILHTFIHTRSVSALHHSLTTKLPSASRLPSPPPSPRPEGSSRPVSPVTTPTSLSREDAQELFDKILDLRRTAIRLEISEPDLWQCMSNSWNQVVRRCS